MDVSANSVGVFQAINGCAGLQAVCHRDRDFWYITLTLTHYAVIAEAKLTGLVVYGWCHDREFAEARKPWCLPTETCPARHNQSWRSS